MRSTHQLRSNSSGRNSRRQSRRGVAAVLAMLFMVIATTLVVGIYSTTTTNAQAAYAQADGIRALASAEGGIQWFAWRLRKIDRPKTTAGTVTATVANSLWPTLKSAIATDLAGMTTVGERSATLTTDSLTSSPIAMGAGDARFTIELRQHPLAAGDPLDQRYLRVTSTGTAGGAKRVVYADFLMDKKIRFAVAGRVPIQIGRNTIVEGAMGMSTASKLPPYLMLSDFAHLNSTLTSKVVAFETFCENNHDGFDNRIRVGTAEATAAIAANYADTNDDGYIDEYDLFLKHYDANNDKAISKSEFTNSATGKLYDANLFTAIDSLSAPLDESDTPRAGYLDDKIDNKDGYAKVHGQILMAASQAAWASNLSSSGKTIVDMMPGPVITEQAGQVPVKFNTTSTDVFDLSPANFEDCAANFRLRSGTNGGTTTRTSTKIENATLRLVDANGTAVTERTPFGSTTYQATFKRPVYKNLTLKNVVIPAGTNALFDNCVFEGVTFVETERDITKSTGGVTYDKDDGSSWASRKISGETFSKDKVLLATGTPTTGQTITNGSRDGNNLRFNNCTFNGPIAGNYATAYTHFANSWEFTGSTLFDNQVDATATIVSPQVNIEMGSFTDPMHAPSTLVGVVVAGNLDIRGTSIVDGSILITGDGAGNTTLGYFGASDADTNPSALPEGGYGRLSIRYNPTRALPDGINVAVDVLPVPSTYRENQ
jgi:hypothetical protein